MSDWGATHSPSILQGLDQEMPGSGSMNGFPKIDPATGKPKGQCQNLCALIQNGTVPMAKVNDSALRVLTPMFAGFTSRWRTR